MPGSGRGRAVPGSVSCASSGGAVPGTVSDAGGRGAVPDGGAVPAGDDGL